MKKLFLLKVAIAAMFAATVSVSCQKYDDIEFREPNALTLLPIDSIEHILPPGPGPVTVVMDDITLVRRLENPYSVVNMRLAYDNMSDVFEGVGLDEDDITTSHFYVKFKPDNEEELQLLKQRYADYDIYEYPLDYEVSGRVSYHDPSLPDTVPTYQYMSIDSLAWNSITRPENVDFEVLERLFIPDEDLDIDVSAYATRSGTLSYEEAIELLVNESMRLTGNLEDEEVDGNGTMSSNDKWYPSGRITAYDDIVDGQVPLQGVKVRARRWFTTRKAYTDADGYFQFDKGFKKKVKYSIVWEGDGWNIREGQLGQAYYRGPEQKGAWNLEIANDGYKSVRYAAIHRAVYRYKKGNIHGLSRINDLFCTNICYAHKHNDEVAGDYNREWGMSLLCDIRIFGKRNDNTFRNIHEIIGTTYHELGHAAHYTNQISRYIDSSAELRESWASFVGYYLTLKEYQELGFPNGPFDVLWVSDANGYQRRVGLKPDYNLNRQLTEIVDGEKYLPIFIDMYDGDNQQIVNIAYNNNLQSKLLLFSNDNIHDIPANIIEGFVFNSYGVMETRGKLTNFLNGNTTIVNSQYALTQQNISNLYLPYTDTPIIVFP